MQQLYGVGQSIVAPNIETAGLAPNMATMYFSETVGAGTFTATVKLPERALVEDVILINDVVWASQTSATLIVGDGDDADGYFTAINAKTTPAATAVGAPVSQSYLGGAAAYAGGKKFYPGGGTITGVITKVGSTGAAGRTRALVKFSVLDADVVAVKA